MGSPVANIEVGVPLPAPFLVQLDILLAQWSFQVYPSKKVLELSVVFVFVKFCLFNPYLTIFFHWFLFIYFFKREDEPFFVKKYIFY